MNVNDGDFGASASGEVAVEQLARLMAEREKTRRLLIGAACLFFVLGAAIVVFAPEGRESLATILGAVLLIFSLGAIGVARFSLKLPGVAVDAGRSGSPANGAAQASQAQSPNMDAPQSADGENIPA